MSINDPGCWNPLYLFIYLFGTNGEIHCKKKTVNSFSILFFAVMNLMMLPAELGFPNLLLLACGLV
jgi:hypothetical protein